MCQICPTGRFQEYEGKDSCDFATDGRVTLGGVIEMKVAKGWRRLCYDNNTICNDTERCSPGRYGTDPPDTDCLLCVAGSQHCRIASCVVLQILRKGQDSPGQVCGMSVVQRYRGEIQR